MPRQLGDEVAPSTLILSAELPGVGCADLRIESGRVSALQGSGLRPRPGEHVIEALGNALLPGLHDHHLHLLALQAALHSVRCGPPAVRDAGGLEQALRLAQQDAGGGWIRGVGYHDSVAGPLGRELLDRLCPGTPLRIQHRSGALWGINSAGLRVLGLEAGAEAPAGIERNRDGSFNGRLLRVDDWLRTRLGPGRPPDLSEVGALLARSGITGMTDATPQNNRESLELFAQACTRGELPQRLRVMGTLALPDSSHPQLERGPLKLWLADAALPRLDWLHEQIAAAHAEGRGVALHCVTRGELVLAASALAAAGAQAGDRIEHASIAPPELVDLLAALPVTVVTQPNFLYERGDVYATEVEARDRPWLYRCQGFLDASIPLAGSTDAPFGEPDPWRAMATAVERRSAGGIEMVPEEALSPEAALALFTTSLEQPGGAPRRIAIGCPADLCLLDRPWSAAREALAEVGVASTLCRGEIAWQARP